METLQTLIPLADSAKALSDVSGLLCCVADRRVETQNFSQLLLGLNDEIMNHGNAYFATQFGACYLGAEDVPGYKNYSESRFFYRGHVGFVGVFLARRLRFGILQDVWCARWTGLPRRKSDTTRALLPAVVHFLAENGTAQGRQATSLSAQRALSVQSSAPFPAKDASRVETKIGWQRPMALK